MFGHERMGPLNEHGLETDAAMTGIDSLWLTWTVALTVV